MNRTLATVALAGLIFVSTAPLLAQGGCVNSPENPTAVLALVGFAGGLVARLRSRARARRER